MNTVIIYFQRKVCKKVLKEKIESQSKIFFLNFELKNFQVFNSPPFPKHGQLGRTWYTSLCSVCMTYRTLYHTVGNQALSAQPLPREADNIPRGSKYPRLHA